MKRFLPSLIAVVVFATLAFVAWDRVSGTDATPSATSPDASPDVRPDVEPVETEPHPTASSTPEPPPTYNAATINILLAKVEILPKRPQLPGYDRDCGPTDACVFGTPWNDDTDAPDGHNGCDTRNDVLRETLDDVRFKEGSNDCDVVGGHFLDPYTGELMAYETEGAQIHIDHLIPLAAAWDLGAATWTQAERETFANDTEAELMAVNGGANQSKGDSTPASWLPPNKGFRCQYVVRYLQASLKYDLPITKADAEVIGFAARKC